jgi:hypothetical protein
LVSKSSTGSKSLPTVKVIPVVSITRRIRDSARRLRFSSPRQAAAWLAGLPH